MPLLGLQPKLDSAVSKIAARLRRQRAPSLSTAMSAATVDVDSGKVALKADDVERNVAVDEEAIEIAAP